MDRIDQTARVTWRGAVPVATRFDDPYFSLDDGAAEAAHVFLAGNDLPGRFADGLHIAELGFGTGLNFLVTLAAWRAAVGSGNLHFTSFEAFPMARTDMARALAVFPGLAAPELLDRWGAGGPMRFAGGVTLRVIGGDARQTLPAWPGRADAWFLDGFAPARNPELWEPDLLAEIARHTAAGGSFATYTAAGHVRRALAQAGFAVRRVRGYGRKRHMSVGRLAAP